MNNFESVLLSLPKSAKFNESLDVNIILLKVPSTLLKLELPSEINLAKVLLISRMQDITIVKTVSDSALDALEEKEVKKLIKNKIIIIDNALSQKILRAYGKYLSKYKIKPYIFNQTIQRTLSNIPATKKLNINKTSLSIKVGKYSEITENLPLLCENIKTQINLITGLLSDVSQLIKFKKILLKTTMGKSYELKL